MTDTFTLTGQLFDLSGQPLRLAILTLRASTKVVLDKENNKVFGPPPQIMTDSNGYLCRYATPTNFKPTPSPVTGVTLVTRPGLAYTLSSRVADLIPTLTFMAGEPDSTVDLSDIAS